MRDVIQSAVLYDQMRFCLKNVLIARIKLLSDVKSRDAQIAAERQVCAWMLTCSLLFIIKLNPIIQQSTAFVVYFLRLTSEAVRILVLF